MADRPSSIACKIGISVQKMIDLRFKLGNGLANLNSPVPFLESQISNLNFHFFLLLSALFHQGSWISSW